MSKIVSTINKIDNAALTYAPMVIAGIQAAEVSGAAGSDKKAAVVDGILAGAQAAEGLSSPSAAAIGSMVDLFVSIFKALGTFKSKAAVT